MKVPARIQQAAESIAANVPHGAPASEWVANIRYQLDVLRLNDGAATTIARIFGLDWDTLLKDATREENP